MDDKSKQKYLFQAEFFKALSNPARIQILQELKTRNWCVCELADSLGISKSVMSKHLSQLKTVGIIEDIKHGTLVEYRLITPCIMDLINCAEKTILENRLKKLEVLRTQDS